MKVYYTEKLGLPQDFVSYTPMGSSLDTRMAVVRAGSLPAAVPQPAEVETLRAAGGLANAHMIMDLAILLRPARQCPLRRDGRDKARP